MLFVFVCSLFLELVLCSDYCSENDEIFTDSKFSFNSAPSFLEHGIEGHPKSLHCCVRKYDSILWFKGNQRYPWKTDGSNFHINPSSGNQTLDMKSLSLKDNGTYSCLIQTNASVVTRTFRLEVHDEYTKVPLPTVNPPARMFVDQNATAKLYCEAFLGKIDLPDAQYKILWYKMGINNSLILQPNSSRTTVRKIIKDNGLTLGLHLVIEKVEDSDYGTYVCSASNSGDQIKEMRSELMKPTYYLAASASSAYVCLALGFFAAVIVVTTGWACCAKYGYRISFFFRSLIMLEKNDENKEYDVFILYENSETHFVNHMLIPTLVSYNFTVGSYCLENGILINMECQNKIAVSRRVVCVLSAPESGNLRDQNYFVQKLYAAANLFNSGVCLVVQHKLNSNDKQIRQHIKSIKHAACLRWPMYKKDWSRMWTSLRSYLPAKSKCQIKTYVV